MVLFLRGKIKPRFIPKLRNPSLRLLYKASIKCAQPWKWTVHNGHNKLAQLKYNELHYLLASYMPLDGQLQHPSRSQQKGATAATTTTTLPQKWGYALPQPPFLLIQIFECKFVFMQNPLLLGGVGSGIMEFGIATTSLNPTGVAQQIKKRSPPPKKDARQPGSISAHQKSSPPRVKAPHFTKYITHCNTQHSLTQTHTYTHRVAYIVR